MQKWYKSQVEFEICTIFTENVIYFGWLLLGSPGSPTKTRLFRVAASASIAPQKLRFYSATRSARPYNPCHRRNKMQNVIYFLIQYFMETKNE